MRYDTVDGDGKITLRYARKAAPPRRRTRPKRKRIILLARDNDVTAIEHGTGEILSEFNINPSRDYQPKKQNTPGPKTGGVVDVSGHL